MAEGLCLACALTSVFTTTPHAARRLSAKPTWGFPKIRGTILGVPIIRTIVFWGLYWGPLILGNYHIREAKYECRACEL